MDIEYQAQQIHTLLANLSGTASQIAITTPQTSAIPYWLFIVLVSVVGFASAGLFNAVRQYSSGSTGLKLSFSGPVEIACTFIMCMFMAPYWIGAKSWAFWWQGKLPLAILAFFSILVVMWSFCSGVVVLQFLYLLGLVGAQ